MFLQKKKNPNKMNQIAHFVNKQASEGICTFQEFSIFHFPIHLFHSNPTNSQVPAPSVSFIPINYLT